MTIVSKFATAASLASLLALMTSTTTTARNVKHSKKTGPPLPFLRGMAFSMTNNEVDNELVVYDRDGKTGTLQFVKTVSTEGQKGRGDFGFGPTDPLTSQDPLIVDSTGSCVILCNAGSNTISSFQIHNHYSDAVTFVDSYPVTGFLPIALSEGIGPTSGIVYVLNTGENGSINAFSLSNKGDCTMKPVPLDPIFDNLPGQDNGLVGDEIPAGGANAGDILISRDGTRMYIPIKSNNNTAPSVGSGRLVEYTLLTGTTQPAEAAGLSVVPATDIPFSFDLNDVGNILLTSALGIGPGAVPGAPAQGSVSLFEPTNNVSAPINFVGLVQSGAVATCWIRYSLKSGGCTYATSPGGSAAISAFRSRGFGLDVIQPAPLITVPSPLDVVFSPDEQFLYVLSTGDPQQDGPVDRQPAIVVYKVNFDTCGLTEIQSISTGLPNVGNNPNGVAGLWVI